MLLLVTNVICDVIKIRSVNQDHLWLILQLLRCILSILSFEQPSATPEQPLTQSMLGEELSCFEEHKEDIESSRMDNLDENLINHFIKCF